MNEQSGNANFTFRPWNVDPYLSVPVDMDVLDLAECFFASGYFRLFRPFVNAMDLENFPDDKVYAPVNAAMDSRMDQIQVIRLIAAAHITRQFVMGLVPFRESGKMRS